MRASEAPNILVLDERAGRVAAQARDNGEGTFNIDRTPIRQQLTVFDTLQLLADADLDEDRPIVAVIGLNTDISESLENFETLSVTQEIEAFGGRSFVLGTNVLGEDVLSRLIFGTRATLVIGIAAALFSSLIGIPLGLFSGYWGGLFDRLLTPIMDSVYSFPGLILAVALVAVIGPGINTIIVAIAVIYVPAYFRVVRSQTLTIKQASYVEAARSLGASDVVIIGRYIFPNVVASVVVVFTINVAECDFDRCSA